MKRTLACILLFAGPLYAAVVPVSGKVGTEFKFTMTTATPDTLIYWDFGDGTVKAQVGNTIKHKYDKPGNYAIKAGWGDAKGGTVWGTENVSVTK